MKGDTRCIDGQLYRHDPQDDDPELETKIGVCPECDGKGCASPVTLADCPIGLFQTLDGDLCLKTEYGNNEGRIDAYIVESGEFFWGVAPQTIKSQRAQLVWPMELPNYVRAATLEAENARLRAALEPFAQAADDCEQVLGDVRISVNLADCRAAKKALEGT